MKTKHTPGPWEVDERILAGQRQPNFRIFAANQVCELTTPEGFYRSPAETEANARLIAAAPEMLELLTLALPYIDESEQFNAPHKKTLSKRVRAIIGEVSS